jgi:hypothetical protein
MSDINCGRVTSSSQKDAANDVTSYHTLVEVELTRKIYYEQLLQSVRRWLLDCGDRIHLSEMQIAHILLRYIFNKKATTRDRRSDPVFVTGTSKLARDQLRRDLKTTNLGSSKELADLIDDELARAARSLRFEKVIRDEPVTLSSLTDHKLIYRDHSQDDFAGLAQRYGTKYYNAAYALGLRYSYVRLTGHGLARAYKEDTKRSADDPLACEGFASAFNHYFDRYYSAFPDLEAFFGSRGCFFTIKWEEEPSDMTYYLCPPFDESLMQLCVDHVFNALQKRLVSRPIFVFSIPGSWTNFSALEQLKASSWVRDLIDYPKGKLPFIDYMAARERDRIIYPTDICVITLTSEAKEGNPSAIDLQHADNSDNAEDTVTIQKKRRNELDEGDNCNPKDTPGTKKIKLD